MWKRRPTKCVNNFFLPLPPPHYQDVQPHVLYRLGQDWTESAIPFLLDAVLQGLKQIRLQKGKSEGKKTKTVCKHRDRSGRPQKSGRTWSRILQVTIDKKQMKKMLLYAVMTRNPMSNSNPVWSYGKTLAHKSDFVHVKSHEDLQFSSTYL